MIQRLAAEQRDWRLLYAVRCAPAPPTWISCCNAIRTG